MASKKKPMTSQAKRRLSVLGTLSVFCIGLFIISFMSYGISLYKLQKEKSGLENKYADLQEKADDLKNEITKLQDPEYLAKFARENYLYSKDGELIIKIHDTKTETKVEEEDIEFNMAVVIGSLSIVGVVIIYVLIRGPRKKKKSNK